MWDQPVRNNISGLCTVCTYHVQASKAPNGAVPAMVALRKIAENVQIVKT